MKIQTCAFVMLISACVIPMQAIGGEAFHSTALDSNRMAVAASPESLERFLKEFPDKDFFVFPETRENPIRLSDAIAEAWTERTKVGMNRFEATAQPGEYFVFQAGIFAPRNEIRELTVQWSDLAGKTTIGKSEITCFNTTGIDYRGREFEKILNVSPSRVQPLWFGVKIPASAIGTYRGQVTLAGRGLRSERFEVVLTVSGERIRNSGFDRGTSLSRLAWLNTTRGTDDNVTREFIPVHRKGNELRILGRTITLAPDGLPSQVVSYFEPSNQFLVAQGTPLLRDQCRFVVVKDDGTILHAKPGPLKFTSETPSASEWTVTGSCADYDVACTGRLEFDGYIGYSLSLKAKRSLAINDIRLDAPLRRDKALYMMGLNHEGGLRRSPWTWQWDTTKNQDMLWVGDVNGGMRIKWTAETYVRPLINIYYAYGPLHLPPSWGNEGKGGVVVRDTGDAAMIRAYSGTRTMKAGDVLHYDFEILLTPTKLIDAGVRWGDRYFHGGGTNAEGKIARADSIGANIINIHHAEDIYPFINYPYLDENVRAIRQLADSAHRSGKRLKLYYTTRELTKNLPEFWALFSLNGEVIFPGPGNACTTVINPKGPDAWLTTNLKENYIPAWLNPIKEGPFAGELDLSVITRPDSRLNNFYIGGLDWMVRNLGIDGVYIDDSALDRLTIRRARKIIDRYRPQGRIDFHSWNHFNELAGFTNCLNLYMDLIPYLDLVWIGEGRDYDRMPDHWLIEVAGVPYGVTGQMLNEGGNPWRGMVYGITNRPPWAGDPSELWKFWDAVKIKADRMIGYWDANSPVRSDNDLVKATIYKGDQQSVIAVAGWGNQPQPCSLSLDWKALGYDPAKCSIHIPRIPGFQEERPLNSLAGLEIPKGKGYLILVTKHSH